MSIVFSLSQPLSESWKRARAAQFVTGLPMRLMVLLDYFVREVINRGHHFSHRRSERQITLLYLRDYVSRPSHHGHTSLLNDALTIFTARPFAASFLQQKNHSRLGFFKSRLHCCHIFMCKK